MDQSTNGSKFNAVGTFELSANDSLVVTNQASATAGQATTYVTIDAIRLQKVSAVTASSKELVMAQDVIAYPVPTTGKLMVTYPEALRRKGTVQVLGLAGNAVLPQQTLSKNVVELNLKGLAAGVYLVVLESPEGKVVKRVVKQ